MNWKYLNIFPDNFQKFYISVITILKSIFYLIFPSWKLSKGKIYKGFVHFLCLMAYQSSWVIQCQSYLY